MIASLLGTIKKELNNINVPYEFMRWTSPVQYPYFIGEYTETSTEVEDGSREYTIMLTGTTTGSWLELENYRAKIEDHFPSVGGLRITTDKGVMVIFYDNSLPVDTGQTDLKRIQINLQIKAWKGMK